MKKIEAAVEDLLAVCKLQNIVKHLLNASGMHMHMLAVFSVYLEIIRYTIHFSYGNQKRFFEQVVF